MSTQRKTAVDKVIHALKAFFEENGHDGTSSVYATTRDIANRSELSIYNTRHVLIKLEQEGVVTSVKRETVKVYFGIRQIFSGLKALMAQPHRLRFFCQTVYA
ncbi:FaeA/PapI family transcriptional regulator [Erwinia aphidicola]|uniref:FaeA/PapI family transcriptional regulator n=1 Tax=Erwinia aphidicola TaxID=68334 RepID=UPI0030CCB459